MIFSIKVRSFLRLILQIIGFVFANTIIWSQILGLKRSTKNSCFTTQ